MSQISLCVYSNIHHIYGNILSCILKCFKNVYVTDLFLFHISISISYRALFRHNYFRHVYLNATSLYPTPFNFRHVYSNFSSGKWGYLGKLRKEIKYFFLKKRKLKISSQGITRKKNKLSLL